MAKIGLRYPVAAKITGYDESGKPTYDDGIYIGAGVKADITYDTADSELYADDILKESDTGVTGYSGSLEVDGFGTVQSGAAETDASVVAYLTGFAVGKGGDDDKYDEKYVVTGVLAPYCGFGYMKTEIVNGVKRYSVTWCVKVQFKKPNESDSTKEKSTSFNTSTIDFVGSGVDIVGQEDLLFTEKYTCKTLTAARELLESLAHIKKASGG